MEMLKVAVKFSSFQHRIVEHTIGNSCRAVNISIPVATNLLYFENMAYEKF